MAFENADVIITGHKRIKDTRPELFVERALDALEREYYESALIEAEKAIKYGKNHPKYRSVKAYVLARMGRYKKCLDYINGESQLWRLKKKGRLLPGEESMVCYACAVSLKGLSRRIDGNKDIIVTPDGRGMCKTIQEAVNKYPHSTILLTAGNYCEDVKIKRSQVIIKGIDYQNTYVKGQWEIVGSESGISGIHFCTTPICIAKSEESCETK